MLLLITKMLFASECIDYKDPVFAHLPLSERTQRWAEPPRTTRAGHARFTQMDWVEKDWIDFYWCRLHHEEDVAVQSALAELIHRTGPFEYLSSEDIIKSYNDFRKEQPIQSEALRTVLLEWIKSAPPALALELMQIGTTENNTELRATTFRSSGRIQLEDWSEEHKRLVTQILTSGIQDPAPDVQAAAIRSAYWLKLEETTTHILPLLQSTDPYVRLCSLRALEHLDFTQAHQKARQLDMVHDSNPKVARLAQKILTSEQ